HLRKQPIDTIEKHSNKRERDSIASVPKSQRITERQYGRQQEVWNQLTPLHTSCTPDRQAEPAESRQQNAKQRETYFDDWMLGHIFSQRIGPDEACSRPSDS